MRPLSDTTHKALLPLGSTTILGRLIDALQQARVQQVLVVTGYRAAEVREFLEGRHEANLDLCFVHNERFATTNNVVSLALALDQISPDKDVLLIECDLVFDPTLISALVEHAGGNVALVDRYRDGMDGTVVAVENGIVTELFPPSAQSEGFSYRDKFKTLNLYRFEIGFCRDILGPAVARYAADIDPSAYYELALGTLVDLPGQRITAEVVAGARWAEVDDPNDLNAVRFLFEPAERGAILDRAHGGHWNYDLLDFAHMRNAHFPTPAMLAAMAHALPALLASYGSAQTLLDEKLSWLLGCDAARIVALHGATQALPILARQFEHCTTALPVPTFGEYARLFAAARSYIDRPGFDLDELDEIAATVELFVVVNPNNPTGTLLPAGALRELVARHPSTTFIVDESFHIFSGEQSMLEQLETEPLDNVVVLASLSKSLGVPGLRLGYLYCSDRRLRARFAAELPIWNLGAAAEHFLELALKYGPELERSIEQTREDRSRLAEALGALNLVACVHPSAANFLLITLADGAPSAVAVREALLRGEPVINVRDVSDRFADGQARLRIAVRTEQENCVLLDALGKLAA